MMSVGRREPDRWAAILMGENCRERIQQGRAPASARVPRTFNRTCSGQKPARPSDRFDGRTADHFTEVLPLYGCALANVSDKVGTASGAISLGKRQSSTRRLGP